MDTIKKNRKEEELKRRRKLILDVAEEIITSLGFESTTMGLIADKAGVGKGTLYLHFDSKASIYLAICERGSRLLNEKMASVLAMDLSGMEMIKMLGNLYLNFVKESPQYFYAFNFYESTMADDKLRASELAGQCEQNAKNGLTYIVRALQVGMQDGSIDNSFDPKQLGIMIWGASRGIVSMAFLKEQGHNNLLDDADVSLDTMVNGLIQLIGRGISGK